MLSKAKDMQEKMREAQEKIKKIEAEGEAGGNLVKVILTGDYELKSIIISDEAKKEDQEIIYDLIKAVTGKSKTIKPTPGLQTFIKHLTELNIPLHIAGTDKVRRYLQTGDIDTHLDPLVTQTNKRKRLETGSGVKKTNNNCIIKRWV